MGIRACKIRLWPSLPGTPGLWDWYHLVKKFKEDLSLACRGRAIRNQHLRVLVRFLWYGLVSEARQYLAMIPAEDRQDTAAIERLEAYSGAQ
jgi:hypothetical protein